MKKRKSVKEQLLATTKSSKAESETKIKNLTLTERISKAERIIPRSKVIRDAFTMQTEDVSLLKEILDRCMGLGIYANKSFIIRAGIRAIANMPDKNFKDIMENTPKIKTGRVKTV